MLIITNVLCVILTVKRVTLLCVTLQPVLVIMDANTDLLEKNVTLLVK